MMNSWVLIPEDVNEASIGGNIGGWGGQQWLLLASEARSGNLQRSLLSSEPSEQSFSLSQTQPAGMHCVLEPQANSLGLHGRLAKTRRAEPKSGSHASHRSSQRRGQWTLAMGLWLKERMHYIRDVKLARVHWIEIVPYISMLRK